MITPPKLDPNMPTLSLNRPRALFTIKGMKSDIRIGKKAYLSPGIGFSGGTLGRDLKVLDSVNKKVNGYAKIFGAIHRFNNKRKYAILDKITKILNEFEGKVIGILGLTYKPGTSTLRRSLPLEIVNLLVERKALVKVYDPKADYSELNTKPEFKISKSIEEVSTDVDMLILLTEWEDFKNYSWENVLKKMNTRYFFDTKNFLNENEMKNYGFHYYSIGRGK